MANGNKKCDEPGRLIMVRKGKIVAVSGVDGSGKTSLILEIERLLQSRGQTTRSVWLRYNHYTTKALLAVCRLLGLTKYEYTESGRVGYHEFYKSKVVSYLFIWLTFIDTLIASFVLVKIPSMLFSTVIICDRWILDILVDLETDTGIRLDEDSFIHKAFVSIMPSETTCVLIERDREAVVDSRKENARDKNFPIRLRLYQQHAKSLWVVPFRNNTSIDKLAFAVLQRTGLV